MRYADIKPFSNISFALNTYYKVTNAKPVKFVKPSNEVDWFKSCCRQLLFVKTLKTIEQDKLRISQLYHIKYESKLFWDRRTVQIKEDENNHSIFILHGAGLIPIVSQAFHEIFVSLYYEMSYSIPHERQAKINHYINLYSNTIDGMNLIYFSYR